MAIEAGTVPRSAAAEDRPSYAPQLTYFVFALFFIFGGITSLNDVLIPKLKSLFTLSYAEVMLVQSAFFGAYFVVSLPAAEIVRRLGYLRTAVVGLLTMTAGCLLFAPASLTRDFPVFLFALFVLASGITIIQVVANPLISLLGAPSSAHSRLTFAQAFNSLGTTIFPYLGSVLILNAAPVPTADAPSNLPPADETRIVLHTYLGLAAALLVLSGLVWLVRRQMTETTALDTGYLDAFRLLRRARFRFGAACIFLYVGAEVAIGSLIVSYLMQASVLGLSQQEAGKHVPFYWGGAMLGRFAGAYVLRLFAPGKVLTTVAGCAIALLLVSCGTHGEVAGWALLSIGLCNSIMFPTIFSLASEGLGARAAEGSGIICMAIVGGAIIPLITGAVGDHAGLQRALLVPAVCYAGIMSFGWYARRPAAPDMP